MMTPTPGEFADLLHIETVESDSHHVVVAMPVAGKRQPFGLLHGGANAVLVEHAASLLGLEICPPGTVPVGTRVCAEHLRPVRDGRLTAAATALATSRTGATIGVEVRDEAGQITARGEQTLVFLPADRLP